MSKLENLTKAELIERLKASEVDDESLAVAQVVKALKPLEQCYWKEGSYHTDFSVVARVIREASLRFGMEVYAE